MITVNVAGEHYFIALPKMLLVLTKDEFARAIRRGKAWKRRQSLQARLAPHEPMG
jgi:hypothetical protein